MHLVPIEAQHVNEMFPLWSQFLPYVARRSKEPIAELLAMVHRREVQPILVWDEQAQKAVALVGMRYHKRGDDLIAEWLWMAGRGYKQWRGLLPELENYLKQHLGVYELRPICRPGYRDFLQERGFKTTHLVMTKVL